MTSFKPKIPASEVLKTKGSSGTGPSVRQSKEEYRKEKELEEARKAATAPAIKDVETGRDINPHIPQFITDAPWYTGPKGPTLNHQKPHPERQANLAQITDWYKRGVSDKVATKYRKGACENCGALTHKKKDCLERPRKIGARWTGDDIAPDEYIQPDLQYGYDAKRDRWNGYDSSTHKEVIEEYEKMEAARKVMIAQKVAEMDRETSEDSKAGPSTLVEGPAETAPVEKVTPGVDEDKYAEFADMPGVKLDTDSRTLITIRNLRIREDTAKYLLNLDPNSAYYDPKSRSMRENPYLGTGKVDKEKIYDGENFVRYTGEAVDVSKAQLFAWEAKRKGVDVHAVAEPTKLQTLKREYGTKKVGFEDEKKRAVLEKYGGEEYLNNPAKDLQLAQTETYVEYSRRGEVIKGVEKPIVMSRYPEDVYNNNHTSVWGSYWTAGEWGYNCCKSTVKNSYCLGSAHNENNSEAASSAGPLAPVPESVEKSNEIGDKNDKDDSGEKSVDGDKKKKGKKAKRRSSNADRDSNSSSSSSSSGSSSDSDSPQDNSDLEREKAKFREDVERNAKKREARKLKRLRRKERLLNKKKKKAAKNVDDGKKKREKNSSSDSEKDEVRKAIKLLRKKEKDAEAMIALGDRKRGYNVTYEEREPTAAEMEAYKLTRIDPNDPMAHYVAEKRKKV